MKIGVVSLGCDKNRVDTENLLYYLSHALECSVIDDYSEAEVMIVNTCAFIAAAREESIDTILEIAALKRTGALKKLIVTGCLPQKHLAELEKGLPEVDFFLGTRDYDKIGEAVRSAQRGTFTEGRLSFGVKRILSTKNHAYLKIAEGCDNRCTFCTIPSIRGGYVSRPLPELVWECEELASRGISEIIVVAQDTSRYGEDLYGENKLVELLRRLTATEIVRCRLMYCYPEGVTDELIDEIASNPKMASYIDMPVQHVADRVLRAMNRRIEGERIRELTRKLFDNGIALRTTLMVGFPGENERDFAELADYVTAYRPHNVGIFAYSREEGTPAYKMKNQVRAKVRQDRLQKLADLAYRNALVRNAEAVGKTLKVLAEGIDYERGMFKGRSEFEAPDVDGRVCFCGNNVEEGCYYQVSITGFDGYDLIGRIVD